jgi:hypothetical protein
MQGCLESQLIIKSSEFQSRGVPHIHQAYVINKHVNMKEKIVRERVFKDLVGTQEYCYFHLKRSLLRHKTSREYNKVEIFSLKETAENMQIHAQQGILKRKEDFDSPMYRIKYHMKKSRMITNSMKK